MREQLKAEFERASEGPGAATPVYVRIRRAIEAVIAAGLVTPGQALIGERELSTVLGVSRVSVRNALSRLVADGLLVQRQGAGTFVAERIVKSFSKLTSFSDDLRMRGVQPRSVFLWREIGDATPEEAMALNLSPGTRVARFRRIRYGGDKPLAVERTVSPEAILPDPSVVENSLYEALDRLGHPPVRALQRLRAIAVDAEQGKHLHLTAGTPGLFIERRAFDQYGRVVEFTRSVYRGDAYDFVAELQSDA